MADTRWRFECFSCGSLFQDHIACCVRCGSWGMVWPRYWSRQAEAIRPAPFRSALSLYALHGRWAKDLPDFLAEALGRLPATGGYLVILAGEPGAGKTSAALRWADAWARSRGRIIFCALEEGSPGAIAIHLRRLEVCAEDLVIGSPGSIEDLQDVARGAAAVFIDSASVALCTGFDLARLAQDLDVPIVATVHTTKAGEPAGPNTMIHAADVVLFLEGGGKIERRKSRYAGIVQGDPLSSNVCQRISEDARGA